MLRRFSLTLKLRLSMNDKSKSTWTLVLKIVSYVVTALLGALGSDVII